MGTVQFATLTVRLLNGSRLGGPISEPRTAGLEAAETSSTTVDRLDLSLKSSFAALGQEPIVVLECKHILHKKVHCFSTPAPIHPLLQCVDERLQKEWPTPRLVETLGMVSRTHHLLLCMQD